MRRTKIRRKYYEAHYGQLTKKYTALWASTKSCSICLCIPGDAPIIKCEVKVHHLSNCSFSVGRAGPEKRSGWQPHSHGEPWVPVLLLLGEVLPKYKGYMVIITHGKILDALALFNTSSMQSSRFSLRSTLP